LSAEPYTPLIKLKPLFYDNAPVSSSSSHSSDSKKPKTARRASDGSHGSSEPFSVGKSTESLLSVQSGRASSPSSKSSGSNTTANTIDQGDRGDLRSDVVSIGGATRSDALSESGEVPGGIAGKYVGRDKGGKPTPTRGGGGGGGGGGPSGAGGGGGPSGAGGFGGGDGRKPPGKNPLPRPVGLVDIDIEFFNNNFLKLKLKRDSTGTIFCSDRR
jgi:hypothetical protein